MGSTAAAVRDEAPAQSGTGATEVVRSSITAGELVGVLGTIAIAAVATGSLALALLGRHDGLSSLVLGLAVAGGAAAVALLAGHRPRISVDRAELGLLAATAAAALWMFLPGFRYAYDDKDPGVYVGHAFVIAREGSVTVDDPVADRGLDVGATVAGRFPGIWTDPDDPTQVTSQFYPLYSALLATAEDLAGAGGVFQLTPLLAAWSVVVATLAARRAAGTLVAAIAAALLVTSMMQVWQAKYPSTEILAQALLGGCLLAAVLALRQRWTGAAFAAGLLLGTGFLARPDGFLYLLAAVGVVALTVVVRATDRRTVALGAGVATTLPFALYNAYVERELYSRVNSVPRPVVLVGAAALLVGAGFVARWLLERTGWPGGDGVAAWLDRLHRPVGAVAAVALGGVLALLCLRPKVFGYEYSASVFTSGEVVRSYTEMSGVWLARFVSPPGLVVMWLGICVLLLGRWRAPLFILVVPGLALLPLYLYDARVSMRLMWWVRRFVPAVVPAIVVLMALALAWALTQRHRAPRALGAIVLGGLLVHYASQSLPLRSHREMGGSWDLAAATADLAGGEQGVFLYPTPGDEPYDPIYATPGAVWWIFDQVTAYLPTQWDLSTIESYQDAFPGQPVFLVTESRRLPARLPDDRFTPAGTIVEDLTVWEERTDRRPDQAETITIRLTAWQLTPSPDR